MLEVWLIWYESYHNNDIPEKSLTSHWNPSRWYVTSIKPNRNFQFIICATQSVKWIVTVSKTLFPRRRYCYAWSVQSWSLEYAAQSFYQSESSEREDVWILWQIFLLVKKFNKAWSWFLRNFGALTWLPQWDSTYREEICINNYLKLDYIIFWNVNSDEIVSLKCQSFAEFVNFLKFRI